jgi:hypothetical protein
MEELIVVSGIVATQSEDIRVTSIITRLAGCGWAVSYEVWVAGAGVGCLSPPRPQQHCKAASQSVFYDSDASTVLLPSRFRRSPDCGLETLMIAVNATRSAQGKVWRLWMPPCRPEARRGVAFNSSAVCPAQPSPAQPSPIQHAARSPAHHSTAHPSCRSGASASAFTVPSVVA